MLHHTIVNIQYIPKPKKYYFIRMQRMQQNIKILFSYSSEIQYK